MVSMGKNNSKMRYLQKFGLQPFCIKKSGKVRKNNRAKVVAQFEIPHICP